MNCSEALQLQIVYGILSGLAYFSCWNRHGRYNFDIASIDISTEGSKEIVAMSESKPLRDVSSVVVLKPSGSGFDAVEVYRGEYVSRSTSRRHRPLEKMVVRTMRAHAAVTNEYLDRHEKSAAKKKNGWLKDAGKNISKSLKKGTKELDLKFPKIF